VDRSTEALRQHLLERVENFSLVTGLPQDERQLWKGIERVSVEPGDENNRSGRGDGVVAQLPDDRVAVNDRHHQIQEDGIRPRANGGLVRLEAVRSRYHSIAGAQRDTQKRQMIDIVIDDQHETSRVCRFSAQDASISGLPTPRGSLRHPLAGDPLSADDAEVGMPAAPAPRADQGYYHSRDTQAHDNPYCSHGALFRLTPV
jgi:hypothetical protein